jgi:plastocyanin
MARDRRKWLMVLVLAAGCGGGEEESGAPTAATVNVAAFKFAPGSVEVRSGGTVTWVNQDRARHTAENDDFDTRTLRLGDRRRVRFDEPGTYEYFCVYHRFMTGTVKVVE